MKLLTALMVVIALALWFGALDKAMACKGCYSTINNQELEASFHPNRYFICFNRLTSGARDCTYRGWYNTNPWEHTDKYYEFYHPWNTCRNNEATEYVEFVSKENRDHYWMAHCDGIHHFNRGFKRDQVHVYHEAPKTDYPDYIFME